MSLKSLVLDRLAAYPGEHFIFAQYAALPVDEQSFERYRDAVVAEMYRRLGTRLQGLRTPPEPGTITIKSWQYGFTGASDDAGAAKSFSDGVWLGLQNYRGDYLSSERWLAYLGALDRPERWIELGREHEDAGWTVEANACFAAARWLAPATTASIEGLLHARSPELPRRLLEQPAADFPAQPFARRHWRAWDMKNYGRLDLPTLLRWECDGNFSVRARIYRSLGQRPHPAAIQALQEGSCDPHPFARAQAVRSLGWCCDPTVVDRLARLAAEDPHPEVRRTAALAAQRIVGFWSFYGQWNAIAAEQERAVEVVRELVHLGLPAFAYDVGVRLLGMSTEYDALLEELEAGALPSAWEEAVQGEYYHWMREASACEQAAPEMSLEEASDAARDADARGFSARQFLRRRELGTLVERRLHAPEWA